jgi:hypothetical protein
LGHARRILGRVLGHPFGRLVHDHPVIGHVVVLGYLATVMLAGIENAIVVGGLSALGGALYSLGIPKDSVLAYETAVKADDFLVMVRGSADELARAKTLLATTSPTRLDVYEASDAANASKSLVHAS